MAATMRFGPDDGWGPGAEDCDGIAGPQAMARTSGAQAISTKRFAVIRLPPASGVSVFQLEFIRTDRPRAREDLSGWRDEMTLTREQNEMLTRVDRGSPMG